MPISDNIPKEISFAQDEALADMAKDSTKFCNAPAIEYIAARLIDSYHSDLAQAKIRYLFRGGTWNKGGDVCRGDISVVSPINRFVSGVDIIFVINLEYWKSLNGKSNFKDALVDHLLSCIFSVQNKDGNYTWKKGAPPIGDFPNIIKRYGICTDDMRAIANSLKEKKSDEAWD